MKKSLKSSKLLGKLKQESNQREYRRNLHARGLNNKNQALVQTKWEVFQVLISNKLSPHLSRPANLEVLAAVFALNRALPQCSLPMISLYRSLVDREDHQTDLKRLWFWVKVLEQKKCQALFNLNEFEVILIVFYFVLLYHFSFSTIALLLFKIFIKGGG